MTHDFPAEPELDFSRFHDLMHRPFTRRCRSMYGGSRHHIALWWEYMAWPWAHRQTLCRLGLHEPAYEAGRRRTVGCWVCLHCTVNLD